MKVSVVAISSLLISESKGESQLRDGDKFTSNSHEVANLLIKVLRHWSGFIELSTKMSKPKSSKQLLGFRLSFRQAEPTTHCTDNSVLITTSSILTISDSASLPSCFDRRSTALVANCIRVSWYLWFLVSILIVETRSKNACSFVWHKLLACTIDEADLILFA
jgi:hypothetical protein